jgi:hypothetical protein
MPPIDKPGVDQLVRGIAAEPKRAGQVRGLDRLIRAIAGRPLALHAFNALAGHSPRLACEFVARAPDPVPSGLVIVAAGHLTDRTVPLGLRLAVAGKLLTALPDQAESVGPVLRSLTSGLGKARALDRLIQLQSRVETCRTLDAEVERMTASVRFRCPKCVRRFQRPELAKHLWAEHRTLTERGKAVESGVAIEAAVAAAPQGEPDRIDRTFLLSQVLYPGVARAAVHQGLASRHWRGPDEYGPLCEAAEAAGNGVCPRCYGGVPPPVPAIRPPLTLADGRLAGDGYVVEVRDTPIGRSASVAKSGDPVRFDPDVGARLPPRLAAVWAGLVAAVVVLPATFLVPRDRLLPAVVAAAGLGAVAIVYLAARSIRPPIPDPSDRAVDLAWERIAPGAGRSAAAVQFLTRLCRTSLTAGTPASRANAVWELVEHAAVLADKAGLYWHLFAASRLLQAVDSATLGRDRVGALADVFEPVLRGEQPAGVGEAAAIVLNDSGVLNDGERQRLRVRLTAAAFAAGLTPADLVALRRAAPALAELAAAGPADHLRALYAVWLGKNTRPWLVVGPAESVLDLVTASPNTATRILRDYPDALLVPKLGDIIDEELGPCAVCTRGVGLAGEIVADPTATVATVRARGGGGEVQFGRFRFAVSDRPPDAAEYRLRSWLRYRAEDLLPQADEFADPATSPRGKALIGTLLARCPLCGTDSVTRIGQMGLLPQEI